MPHPKQSFKIVKHHDLETVEVVSQYMDKWGTSDWCYEVAFPIILS